ncbi:MAG TPA: hypothetical protein VF119_04740 [Candidatus Limnocylindrales bacterium]
MTRGAAIGSGLLVTLATPATWPLALATFLIRGGIVLFLVPIVVLPTPVGLGTTFGPTLTAFALGRPPIEALAGVVIAVSCAWLWVIGGGWLAAALEAEGARLVAADEGLAAALPPGSELPEAAHGGRAAARILAARLIANLPLLAVLAWGSVRLVLVTYSELTSPLDVSTPIALRVLRRTPEVVAAVMVVWMAGEIVGAVAARRIVLAGDGVGRALGAAVGSCLRHPVSTLARFWLPTSVLVLIVATAMVAATAAWAAAGSALDEPGDPLVILVSVVALVLLWVAGLVLASVVCAWRAAVWTMAEVHRQGTFGGSSDRRPGDWRTEGSSATL